MVNKRRAMSMTKNSAKQKSIFVKFNWNFQRAAVEYFSVIIFTWKAVRGCRVSLQCLLLVCVNSTVKTIRKYRARVWQKSGVERTNGCTFYRADESFLRVHKIAVSAERSKRNLAEILMCTYKKVDFYLLDVGRHNENWKAMALFMFCMSVRDEIDI